MNSAVYLENKKNLKLAFYEQILTILSNHLFLLSIVFMVSLATNFYRSMAIVNPVSISVLKQMIHYIIVLFP